MTSRIAVLFCLLALAPAVFGAATNYFELDPVRFKSIASQEIRMEALNHDLLASAVLRETNERRRQRGFAVLKHHTNVAVAAKIQSEIMRARGAISHENPENPRYRNLELRAKAVGLKYRILAENVATAFALQYESGKVFYFKRKSGRPVYSYSPGGPAIPPHSYSSFAKALVDAWMNSKGHRDNILLKDAEHLGVHCSPATDKQTGMPMFYCTQVFFKGDEKSPK